MSRGDLSLSCGFMRDAWLVVARGGWWPMREILAEMPDGVEIDDPQNRLWIMVNRYRYLVKRGTQRKAEYAVTADCNVPQGLNVRQLNQALATCLKNTPAPGGASTAGEWRTV